MAVRTSSIAHAIQARSAVTLTGNCLMRFPRMEAPRPIRSRSDEMSGTYDALLAIMRRHILSAVAFCASVSIVLALAATHASAQTADPPASTIRVTGEGSVTSRPDRVELDLGVVTRAATAQQAASENAQVAQNVLAYGRRSGRGRRSKRSPTRCNLIINFRRMVHRRSRATR